MNVLSHEDLSPKIQLTTFDEIPSLLFVHRVIIRNSDELFVAEALGVGDIRKVGIALLAEFTNNQRLIQLEKIS